MSHTYPDPIQGANSPFAKTLPYEPMPYYPTVVLPTMTLRDYFAAAALKGQAHRFAHPHEYRELLAQDCYDIADAMLKAREAK